MLALKWLEEHQLPDGSWSYDHRGGRCQGRCKDHGNLADAKIAATSQAVLAFLAAGRTHKEGASKICVKNGLAFLLRSMKVEGQQRGDLMEPGGTMYSHGLASLVLCEAWAMSKDKGLEQPAQLALNHIIYAQDPIGGGWRYVAKQPGDTSVFGWQMSALKSGHLAELDIPPHTVVGASRFLDSVQADNGAQYGYTSAATPKPTTTTIGLYGRTLLGWKRDHPALERGVKHLAKTGPSKGDMYYNFYGTLLMQRRGRDEWKAWWLPLRDQLVASQVREGHEAGSWFMSDGDHGSKAGGRLYCTAMAAMTLEIYYRHLQVFQPDAGKKEADKPDAAPAK